MEKRSNDKWLADLRSTGPDRDAALEDLRQIILSGLPYALSKWLPNSDPQFAPLAEEVAQDTLLRVLDRLDTFEGRSQFTTWVHTIAVRIALTELRRQKWRDVSLESLTDEDDPEIVPLQIVSDLPATETLVEKADLLTRVQHIIDEELTEKQRRALVAVAFKGMPLGEVARRMGMERNALYKLLHDARLHLKRRLEKEGILTSDVFEAIEQG
ncbi:MAG: RNA polymerase sigma factor [Anaerolineaceae bacterium]|nr:RNA polymerase sigma factor [Anaerolineaceae bacterium]